jgi:hypothetical protein
MGWTCSVDLKTKESHAIFTEKYFEVEDRHIILKLTELDFDYGFWFGLYQLWVQ